MKRGCFLLNYIALIVLLCTSITLSDVPSIVNDTIDTQHLAVADREFGYDFLHAYRTALRNGLRGVKEATRKNATTECGRDVNYLLNNNTELLMKYVDAIGKPRSGYLRGNVMWLGSYSECQDIPNAQYCTTTLVITAPRIYGKIHVTDSASTLAGALWGLCFPKSCSSQDVGMYLNEILKDVGMITRYKISVKGVMCPAEKPTYTTGVKVTIALCGVLLFLCLIATVVDYLDETFNISPIPKHISDITATDSSLMNHTSFNTSIEVDGVDNTGSLTADDVLLNRSDSITLKIHFAIVSFKASGLGQFFQCFSVLQNTAKILKTDVTPSAIRSINGIRVISITWVILGHAFSTAVGQLADNRAGAVKDSQSLSMMAILSGTYSVDSFFFLSGLLVAYTCFRKLERNDGSFNWVLFYVHRFWRLTPSYMFVILFSVHLKGFLTESPFWHTQFTDPLCSKNWWTNLLYINNFYPKSAEDCIGWSWYLANDMQFFVISPFLIYPLFKVGWRGLVLPLGLLLEAFVITGFIHAHWDLDPLDLLRAVQLLLAPKPETLKSLNEYMEYIYVKPYCRIQVYLVGVLLGYVMHRYGKSKTRTPGWIMTLIGWSIAFVVAMLLVYGPHKSILPGAEQWNAAEKVIFGTFHRFLWGLVLAWVTYACHYGAGGLVQKFLSARFWIPLSRLTYNVYLIHPIILALMFYGAKGTLHYDLYTATYYFLACVVLSYGAAYVLAVVIEFPCANLEELVLKCIRKVRKRGD